MCAFTGWSPEKAGVERPWEGGLDGGAGGPSQSCLPPKTQVTPLRTARGRQSAGGRLWGGVQWLWEGHKVIKSYHGTCYHSQTEII